MRRKISKRNGKLKFQLGIAYTQNNSIKRNLMFQILFVQHDQALRILITNNCLIATSDLTKSYKTTL